MARFDLRAFATEFAKGQAADIPKRFERARQEGKEQKEIAERNLSVITKRTQMKDVLKGYAATLSELGASPEQIMFYAKEGPTTLKKIHDLVVNKAAKYKEASKGDKLSAEDINEMMKMPQEFTQSAEAYESVDDFLEKGFRLSDDNDTVDKPETPEVMKGNLLFGLMGFNAKDRMKQKLEKESFYKGLSISEINRLAKEQDFVDPFGGTRATAVIDPTAGPIILDSDQTDRMQTSVETKFTRAILSPADEVADFLKSKGISGQGKIATALINAIKKQDPSGLTNIEGASDLDMKDYYNDANDFIKYDIFKDVTNNKVGDATIKFFSSDFGRLYEKFEKAEEEEKGTVYTLQSINAGIIDGSLKAGDVVTARFKGGVTDSFTITDAIIKKATEKKDPSVVTPSSASSTPSGGVLSKEEYDKIPNNDGAPGIALTPSGSTKGKARKAWFDTFEDTHYPSGKKKPYSVYLNNKGMMLGTDNKIVPITNPYTNTDLNNIRG